MVRALFKLIRFKAGLELKEDGAGSEEDIDICAEGIKGPGAGRNRLDRWLRESLLFFDEVAELGDSSGVEA